jgi:putative membrane protein
MRSRILMPIVVAVFCLDLGWGQGTAQGNMPSNGGPSAAPQNAPSASPSAPQSTPSATGSQNAPQTGTSPQPSPAKNSSATLSDYDKQFLQQAADGGLAEVELGQLAVQKAASDDVKKFGQRMVDDHSKANQQLQQIASSNGVQLPQQPSAGYGNTKQMLSGLSGQAFDIFYLNIMLKDHNDDVAAFTRENLISQNPAVKSFASSTLPVLQDHLNTVTSIITAQNKNTQSTSASTATTTP